MSRLGGASSKQKTMGLGSFTGDDDDDENDTPETSGSAKKYTKITEEDMVEFLSTLPFQFEQIEIPGTHEIVWQTTGAPITLDNIRVRLYSTINKHDGQGRDKGKDAIRTVLVALPSGMPVGGRKKTLRIQTWRKNLREKVIDLVDEADSYVDTCPACQEGHTRIVDGQYGEFLGCTKHPDCEFMCFEYDDGDYVARTSKNGTAGFGDSRDEAVNHLKQKLQEERE